MRANTTPDLLRMLSISNTDHKILAGAVAKPLAEVAAKTVVAQQRGGIKGRALADNILDMETRALLAARIATTWPRIVLFDFKAALPSISWVFLFAVLRLLGVPACAISFIKNLYKHCTHFIR